MDIVTLAAARKYADTKFLGFVPKGAYNPANENKYGEWYTHEGGSYGYIYPTPSTGVPVTDTTHWQQIASVGGQDLVDAAVAARDAATEQAALAQGYAAQLAAGLKSPKGVYANLAALIADALADTDEIYVTSDNNYWNYHNGVTWVTGSPYQAAVLANQSITPVKTSFMDLFPSKNRYNLADPDYLTGYYLNANGTVNANASYNVTGFIPVTSGETLVFSYKPAGNQAVANMRSAVAYDAAKNVLSGNTSGQTSYVVPAGAAFVRFGYSASTYGTAIQIEASESGFTPYELWHTPDGTIKTDSLPQIPPENTSFCDEVPSKNRFNLADPDFLIGQYISASGSTSNNAGYNNTGFIPVTPGEKLYMSYISENGTQAIATMRFICLYNADKVVVAGGSNDGATSFLIPAGIAFVRVGYNVTSYGTTLQIEAHDRGFTPYEAYSAMGYTVNPTNLPVSEPLHCFIPRKLYVAVDRTIELYNNQVCLESTKYHLRWRCDIGTAMERKFSITGTAAMLSAHSAGLTNGNYTLFLDVYNDDKQIVWSSRTVITVVAKTPATKIILPIGDSLTNWKAWLAELLLLGGGALTTAGTRYCGATPDSEDTIYPSGTILHEGRSGWSAADYLANAAYTFDDRYSGASGVAGTVNPFWDGSKFSLQHYLTSQAGHIGGTPDAVQIFLGTNGMAEDPTANANNIKAMIDTITSEYPTMPIFLVNTIYRSTQNGYANAGAWRYSEDSKVFDLMVRLDSLLNGYTGVTVIPLAVCHDTQYNFGAVETPVNPRAAQTELMPVEAVHPNNQGYFQMADLFFSTYCGVLGSE